MYLYVLARPGASINRACICYLKGNEQRHKLSSRATNGDRLYDTHCVEPIVISHLSSLWKICCTLSHLSFLQILFFHTGATDAISALAFLKPQMLVHLSIIVCPMNFFFENRVGFYGLEFRFEAIETMAVGAAIGTATGVGEFVAVILRLVSWCSPVKESSAKGSTAIVVDPSPTNCPCLRLLSSPFWDQRQCVRSWQRSEEDAGIRRQCRQRGRRGHGRFAYENESLFTSASCRLIHLVCF